MCFVHREFSVSLLIRTCRAFRHPSHHLCRKVGTLSFDQIQHKYLPNLSFYIKEFSHKSKGKEKLKIL